MRDDIDIWEQEYSDFRWIWNRPTRFEFWLLTSIITVGTAAGWLIGWIV